ncbi:MAG: mechanosensitive ion channel family protein [Gammaproteobacteria bacterium]
MPLNTSKIYFVRLWLVLLLCLFAGPGYSSVKSTDEVIAVTVEELNQLNAKLGATEDENAINPILEQKNQALNQLIGFLRNTTLEKLPSDIKQSDLDFLTSRIAVNQKRNNTLAVKRDQAKLNYYRIDQSLRDYLGYLIAASNDYVDSEEIVLHSQQTRDTLGGIENDLALPTIESENAIFDQLRQNLYEFQNLNTTFHDIIAFVINNPDKISESHWFKRLTLLSAIDSINRIDAIKPVNHKLAPFSVDIGGLVIALIIAILVFFWYPFIKKSCNWILEKHFLNKQTEFSDSIYQEVHRPIRYLLLFFSIDLATYALLYKTEYKASFEHFAFIVYAALYMWLLFKLLDAILFAQINRLTEIKKDLRRELIHLGFQALKGLVFIAILALTLNHFGISITAIMSTLGIGGLAFALAAKDTLSNLFGGVMILIDNIFRMGDWVAIGDEEGTVVEIGLRSTTIRTFDNALITIPNSVISVSSVRNWNRRAIGRRIKMHIGVTYESDMDHIRQALEDIRAMLREHPGIANPKEKYKKIARKYRLSSIEDTHGIKATQLVYLDRYNDFSIDILIYCFAKTVNWEEWLQVKEDVLFKIAEILRKNQLNFAYPTQVRIHRPEHPIDEAFSQPVFEKLARANASDS